MIFTEGFTRTNLVTTVNRAAPYYIAGVAVAIGFKMNLFNIGVEGQYRVAMLGTVAIELALDILTFRQRGAGRQQGKFRGEVLAVQSTSSSNMASRITKIANHENVGAVRESGMRIVVHGWRKTKAGPVLRVEDVS